jgi:predicted porin
MGVDYGNSFGIRAHRSLRLSNALFTSFKPVDNVTVKFDHGFSEVHNAQAVQSASAEANLGVASVIAGYWTNNVGAKSSTLGAKFNVPITKTQVLLSSTQDTNPGVADVKAWTVAARQPITSNVNLEVGYGENQTAKLFTVKSTYALSKRTSLLLAGYKIDHDVVAQSRRNIGVGVEHNF